MTEFQMTRKTGGVWGNDPQEREDLGKSRGEIRRR